MASKTDNTTLLGTISFITFCVMIIFSALAYGTVHQPIIAAFYLVVALLLILWAVDSFRTGRLVLSDSPLQIPLLAAAIYAWIQIFPFGTVADIAGVDGVPRTISLDPYSTSMTALHFFALFLFFALLLPRLDSAGRLRRLAAVITVFGFAFAFFAILQSFLSPDRIYGIYEVQNAVPFGSFVNRHNFAAYMELTIALPLGMLFAGSVERDKRLLFVTAASLMGVALLLSGSRGGLVAFAAQLIFLAFVSARAITGNTFLLRAALIVVLLAAIVGGAIFVGGETSLTRIAETAASKDVTTDRAHIWRVTLDVIKSNLPLGAGLGAFGIAYTAHDSYGGMERVEQAHNDYLQVVADAGIPGILIGGAFLFFLFKAGRIAVKVDNRFRRGIALGAASGCFAILVHSLFDFVLHTTAISILFLTLVALIVASRNSYSDDIPDEPRPKHGRREPLSSKIAKFRS
jgi:O-antigen ligase